MKLKARRVLEFMMEECAVDMEDCAQLVKIPPGSFKIIIIIS